MLRIPPVPAHQEAVDVPVDRRRLLRLVLERTYESLLAGVFAVPLRHAGIVQVLREMNELAARIRQLAEAGGPAEVEAGMYAGLVTGRYFTVPPVLHGHAHRVGAAHDTEPRHRPAAADVVVEVAGAGEGIRAVSRDQVAGAARYHEVTAVGDRLLEAIEVLDLANRCAVDLLDLHQKRVLIRGDRHDQFENRIVTRILFESNADSAESVLFEVA